MYIRLNVMALQVKALASKSDDLSFASRTIMMEELTPSIVL